MEYPYLPPCIVSAACALVGAGLGYTFIEEVWSRKEDPIEGADTDRLFLVLTDTCE